MNWSGRITNNEPYGGFPKVSEDIRKRRLKFPGYCVLFWEPSHGSKSLGRPARTYVDCWDAGILEESPYAERKSYLFLNRKPRKTNAMKQCQQ